MRILTFSSLYPNNVDPSHGIFVERRLRELTGNSDIEAVVVSPVPWFPFRSNVFGAYASMARIARYEKRQGMDVLRPRFPLLPKVGMSSAAKLMALACSKPVRDLAAARSVALIDAHYFYPDGVAAAAIARKLGLPYVITARGSDINLIASYASPRRQMLEAAAGASGLIAVSNALGEAMCDLGMPRDRIHVLRNGVDLGFFCPGDTGAAPSRTDAAPTFLSVGALKEAKGHEIAIEFAAAIDNARLDVVGSGPDEDRLRRLAGRLGAGNRIQFTGTLAAEALRAHYRSADALILMSSREGMPNVVLESLACGTPVLASAVGGIPEIVCEAQAGELALTRDLQGLRDAWARLSARRVQREEVRAFAARFSWSDTTGDLARLMRRAVAGNGDETKHRIT